MKPFSGQPISHSFDPHTTKPLDVRMVINTAQSRLQPETWQIGSNYFVYPGLLTICADTGTIYSYIGAENSPTDIASSDCWIRAGMGGIGTGIDSDELVTVKSFNKTLELYVSLETLKRYAKDSSLAGLALKSLVPLVDSAMSTTSHNLLENATITTSIKANASDISSLQTQANNKLKEILSGHTGWVILILGLDEALTLTSRNTIPDVLYFSIEPED